MKCTCTSFQYFFQMPLHHVTCTFQLWDVKLIIYMYMYILFELKTFCCFLGLRKVWNIICTWGSNACFGSLYLEVTTISMYISIKENHTKQDLKPVHIFVVTATYIVVKCFSFTRMITCFSPLRSCTIQVPEYTEKKKKHHSVTGRMIARFNSHSSPCIINI